MRLNFFNAGRWRVDFVTLVFETLSKYEDIWRFQCSRPDGPVRGGPKISMFETLSWQSHNFKPSGLNGPHYNATISKPLSWIGSKGNITALNLSRGSGFLDNATFSKPFRGSKARGGEEVWSSRGSVDVYPSKGDICNQPSRGSDGVQASKGMWR